jgi:probable HAF family extracellular repeat protein
MKTNNKTSITRSGRLFIFCVSVFAIFGFVSIGLAEKQPQSYSFLSVEVPDGQGALGFTSLAGINDKGEIVGGFTAGQSQGFVISKRSEITRTGCPNASLTALLGINNSGSIAGSCDNGASSAFFRNRQGHYTLIDVPGAVSTHGEGLNDLNQVVGYYRDETGDQHGFLWNDGAFFTFDLPDLENVIPYPHGINNRGQIVGTFAERPCNCNERGFLFSQGSLTIIDFPGASATLVNGINDQGDIVGTYVDSNGKHGFVLNEQGFKTLDIPFAGIDFTEAQGINNRGEIVGRYLQSNPIYNFGFVAIPKRRF